MASLARHASRSTWRFSLAKSLGDNASVGDDFGLGLTLGFGRGRGFGGVASTLTAEDGNDDVTEVPLCVGDALLDIIGLGVILVVTGATGTEVVGAETSDGLGGIDNSGVNEGAETFRNTALILRGSSGLGI